METLKKHSFKKREETLMAEMNFGNKANVSPHFENRIMMLGICSNCLNNSNCVWMQGKKIECEEYS